MIALKIGSSATQDTKKEQQRRRRRQQIKSNPYYSI